MLKTSNFILYPIENHHYLLWVDRELSLKCIHAVEKQLGGPIVIRKLPPHVFKNGHAGVLQTQVKPLQFQNISIRYILGHALDSGASDCYIEQNSKNAQIRYRSQGLLTEPEIISQTYGQQLISTLLIFAHLNVDQTDQPKEGHFHYTLHNKLIFCRLSYVTSENRKSLVLRLFYDTSKKFQLSTLGLPKELQESLQTTLPETRSGLILLTGPTGSGKTTTLYSLLRLLVQNRRKIITLEDPIEAEIEGVVQTEINVAIGYDFSTGLRAILRQDPDVIVIGEIRDKETAYNAFQATLSGYLVLTTLHTKLLKEVPFRCLELGIELDTFYDNILYVIHQTFKQRHLKNSSPHTPHFEYKKFT